MITAVPVKKWSINAKTNIREMKFLLNSSILHGAACLLIVTFRLLLTKHIYACLFF
jgi:hypothetical protein